MRNSSLGTTQLYSIFVMLEIKKIRLGRDFLRGGSTLRKGGGGNYTLSRVSLRIEETDYYASLLISNSNPSYVEVLTAFNDFVKGFPGKLE